MIDVVDYVKLLLRKKKWTLQHFADKINEVKRKAGLDGRTSKQNISNYLNRVDEKHVLRPKQLAIWEVALGLEQGTLMSMVAPVATKDSKQELNEIIRKVRGIKNERK